MLAQYTRRSAGFTLVEIMIVIVILGILGAMVVPQFTSATDESRVNAVQMDLYRIRQQIEIYTHEHNDRPSLDDFAEQMTRSSDVDGNTAAVGTDGYKFGPYLGQIPINPYTGTNDIADISADPGDSGWVYDESDGTFRANGEAAHLEW